jgi:hypothetical protein
MFWSEGAAVMKLTYRLLLIATAFQLLSPRIASAQTSAADADTAALAEAADWRENYAYAVGLQAVIYGYPAVKALNMRYGMVEKPVSVIDTPVNQLFHLRRAADPTDANHSSPATDFLYSVSWYDVRREPVVVSVPESGDRYYSVQFMEYYSDVFAYVGTRATGGKAGSYLLAGADWKGETPAGITDVIRAPTPTGAVLIRVGFRDDRSKLDPVYQMQNASDMRPLSKWLGRDASPSTERDVIDPVAPGTPLAYYVNLNRAMAENPPPIKDRAMVSLLRSVGLGPEQSDDLSKLDAGTRKGLERALKDGLALISQTAISGGNVKTVNHWAYNPTSWGRTAEADDFLIRSATQSFSGFLEHHIEEVVKLRAHHDGDGAALDGSKGNYVLRFGPDQIPQAKAFWSVTVYTEEYNLFANPAGRYSFGNVDKELKYDKDGGVTFHLQVEAPAKKLKANWLPIPSAPFNLFLRAYLPDDSLIRQTYVPPPVNKMR